MKVYDIYKAIDVFAPFKNAEKWDNSGILAGDKDAEVKKVLLTLDVTENVIDEAIKTGANLIISHHPVIFDPLKNVLANSIIYRLIKNDISVISAHTNLDISPVGVNFALANAIGIKNQKPLAVLKSNDYKTISVYVPKEYAAKVKESMFAAGAGKLGNYSGCAFVSKGMGEFKPNEKANPFTGSAGEKSSVDEEKIECICPSSKLGEVISAMKSAHPYEVPAYNIFNNSALSEDIYLGLIGDIEEMTGEELALKVKKALNAGGIRFAEGGKTVKKVAVCSGSGVSELGIALAKGADAFITGDVKHNYMVDAVNMGFTLIDAGHFATENIVLPQLKGLLEKSCKGVEFTVSVESKDPSRYL